jgi:hypothetical protein
MDVDVDAGGSEGRTASSKMFSLSFLHFWLWSNASSPALAHIQLDLDLQYYVD